MPNYDIKLTEEEYDFLAKVFTAIGTDESLLTYSKSTATDNYVEVETQSLLELVYEEIDIDPYNNYKRLFNLVKEAIDAACPHE